MEGSGMVSAAIFVSLANAVKVGYADIHTPKSLLFLILSYITANDVNDDGWGSRKGCSVP
jgi:hypothetical protein